MTFMDANGGYYTVSVTKHKSQPDGYTGGMKNKFAETQAKIEAAEVEVEQEVHNESNCRNVRIGI